LEVRKAASEKTRSWRGTSREGRSGKGNDERGLIAALFVCAAESKQLATPSAFLSFPAPCNFFLLSMAYAVPGRFGRGIALAHSLPASSVLTHADGCCHRLQRRIAMSRSRREHLPYLFGAATLAIMFGAVPVHSQTATESAGASGATATSSAGESAKSSISKADQNLMRDLAQANMSEIEAGKLAQSKSKNEQVLKFAQQMVDDHTKAQQQLQQLAQAKGVTLPTEPDAKHKAEMKMLSALSGDAFDRQYMARGGVADHKSAHKLVQRVEKRAADPDLKALAGKMLPTIDQHLAMAEEIHGGKAGAKSTSGTSGASGAK
jgi:putative membrane protein